MHGDLLSLDIQIPIRLIEVIDLVQPPSAKLFSYDFGELREAIGIFGKAKLDLAGRCALNLHSSFAQQCYPAQLGRAFAR